MVPWRMPTKHTGKVANWLLLRNFIFMSSAMVRSSLIKELRFNDNYNLIGDYDLWLRISVDHRLKYVDEVLLHYRRHEDCMSLREKSNWIYEQRSHYRFFLSEYGLRYPMVVSYILSREMIRLFQVACDKLRMLARPE